MLNPEKVKITGHLIIRVLDGKTRNEKRRIETPNLVVNGTKTALVSMLCNTNCDKLQAWGIGVGTDNTPPAVSHTDLQCAAGKMFKKKYDTSGRNFTEDGHLELQMTVTTDEGIQAVGDYYCEAGLFTRGDAEWAKTPDPMTGSKMLARQLHAPIHKDGTISLEYTWRLQIAIS